MAKLKLLNTREHSILLNSPHNPVKPLPPVHVPGARRNAIDDKKLTPGVAEIESDHLDVLKKDKVVQHYFSEGWLRIDKGGDKPKTEEK